MKTKTQHTPTPWQYEKIGNGFTVLTVDDCSENSKSICTTFLGNKPKDSFEDEANAAFIVRAVNRDHAFEALLEVLQTVSDGINTAVDARQDWSSREMMRHLFAMQGLIHKAMKQAEGGK